MRSRRSRGMLPWVWCGSDFASSAPLRARKRTSEYSEHAADQEHHRPAEVVGPHEQVESGPGRWARQGLRADCGPAELARGEQRQGSQREAPLEPSSEMHCDGPSPASGYPCDGVGASLAQAAVAAGAGEQRSCVGGERRDAAKGRAPERRVRGALTLQGMPPGALDARRDGRAALGARVGAPCVGDAPVDVSGVGGVAEAGYQQAQVEAVEQRAADARPVAPTLARIAAARALEVAVETAWAGVHRGHELHRGRVAGASPGASQHQRPRLQRLPQGLEHSAIELGQFVEEQHPAVRQAQVAWPAGPADHTSWTADVVRLAKGRPAIRGVARVRSQRVQARDLQRGGVVERRQQAREAACEQRLPAARRADQQQMVCAGGHDLECALGGGLAAHLGEVGARNRRWARRIGCSGCEGRRRRGAARPAHRLAEVGDADHREARHPCGVPGLRQRQHHRGAIAGRGVHRHGERATHRTDGAVQPQLAHDRSSREPPRRHALLGREQRQGDREVERRALLAHVGRSEVHDHAAGRQRRADRAERRTDPLLRLTHRGVGQPHHVHRRKTASERRLDADLDDVAADQRRAPHRGVHETTLAERGPCLGALWAATARLSAGAP
jgi:hypothetical protein